MSAQETQLFMTKGAASMNVHSDNIAAYLADGWVAKGICYSEGGDTPDTSSLILLTKGAESMYVRVADLFDYIAAGWNAVEVFYGAGQLDIPAIGAIDFSFLDTPAFSSAEIGTVDATTLAVTFSTEIHSSNYATGVTIKVNSVSKTISAAVRQTDHKVVYYTIPTVANGDTVTWSYDDETGGIHSEVDGSHLDDVTNGEVTNNVAAG